MSIEFKKGEIFKHNEYYDIVYHYKSSEDIAYWALYKSNFQNYTLTRSTSITTHLYTNKGWQWVKFHDMDTAKILTWRDVINIVTLDIL